MPDLLECLQTNQTILGNQCINLGQSIKTGWLGYHKIFLAYDNSTGWKITQLNILQLFLRKIFNFYKETHLNEVFKMCRNLSTDHSQIADCQRRIQAQWDKKNLSNLGNANLSNAQVICFAESHEDESFRSRISHIIDTYYREGDIILVEGLAANETEKRKEHDQTFLIKRECLIQGWEPVNFDNLPGNKYALAEMQYRQYQKQSKQIQELCQTELTNEQLVKLEKKIKSFLQSMNQVHIYYETPIKLRKKREDIVNEYFNQIKAQHLPNDRKKEALFLKYVIYRLVEPLNKEWRKHYQKNKGSIEFNQVLEQRNHSLIQKIAKHAQINQRIFVIAGASHLLKFPSSYMNIQKVTDELKKHLFLILTNKN